MLKLIAARPSPFARKVRIVLAEKKLDYQMVETSPWEAGNPVHAYNPLGKVPVLLLDDGTTLFDSRVIVEYIDSISPVSKLIPEQPRQRIVVRRWEALADGVCDAAVLLVLESRRPAELRSSDWIAHQERKLQEGVAAMSADLAERPWCNGEAYTLADIAAGCALGYLDLRLPALDWRAPYENLARHAEKLGKRASFADTRP